LKEAAGACGVAATSAVSPQDEPRLAQRGGLAMGVLLKCGKYHIGFHVRGKGVWE